MVVVPLVVVVVVVGTWVVVVVVVGTWVVLVVVVVLDVVLVVEVLVVEVVQHSYAVISIHFPTFGLFFLRIRELGTVLPLPSTLQNAFKCLSVAMLLVFISVSILLL